MDRSIVALLSLPFGLVGCAVLSNDTTSYYGEGWDPPEVSGLSVTSEVGNLGGGTLVISGSGFGDDPAQVLVQFGDESAEVLAVADGQVTVEVPPGPITGGAVQIRVATPTGFTASEQTYTYELGDLYDREVAYVQVNNYWESCYGGLSDRLDDEWGGLGCNTIAYIGTTGIEGTATALNFAYPRFHAENIGFFTSGATMQGGDGWSIQRPAPFPYAAMIDDLHEDIGDIVLHNEKQAGETFCADLDDMAVYYYGGGIEGYEDPVAVGGEAYPGGRTRDTCEEGTVAYPLDELRFCSSSDAEGVPDYVYRADWPVAESFFEAGGRGNEKKPVDIVMDAPGAGISGQALALPEPLIVYGVEGFEPITDEEGTLNDIWSLSPLQGCFDDDGNGEKLNDNALTLSWTPSEAELTPAGDVVKDARTYVRITLTQTGYGWLGISGFPMRATLTVDDKANWDRATGLSSVQIPAEVLYQIPTSIQPPSSGFSSLADPGEPWAFLMITVERVTEYRLESETLGGDVVFAYVTGDFGFFDWTNPTDADACHNCLDDDGDGWTDADDPDCEGGAEETGRGDTACNDGIDNDGDGDEDAQDADCADGEDDDETDCDDELDNDDDGYLDTADPGCQGGGNEADDPGTGSGCTDGADEDGDGWIDAADPDCATGTDEIGFGTTQCNDGTDNDADSSTDSADPECADAADDDEAT